jgi:hypothetical protein
VPNFSRIITLAYMRILERPPDPGGLQNFNQLMNDGLTEAMMREALLRSAEYAQKNPDRTRGSAVKVERSAARGPTRSRKARRPRSA